MHRTLPLIWLSCLLLSPGLSHATIYKVVDEHGNVTYTDIPPADRSRAEPVKLPAINTRAATELQPQAGPEAEREEAGDNAPYIQAAISSPENDFTLPPGQQSLAVEVALEPGLQEGHWVQILVDGSAAGSPVQSSAQSLQNLERGMHFISAHVLDGNGRIVAETDTITVHVQRSIVGGPASGQPRPPGAPAPRPAPK